MHTSPRTFPRFGARGGVATSLVVAGALAISACGSDGTTAAGEAGSTPAPAVTAAAAPSEASVGAGPVAPPPASNLPAVGLLDTASGDQVNLQTVVDGERPLLFWFWAPH